MWLRLLGLSIFLCEHQTALKVRTDFYSCKHVEFSSNPSATFVLAVAILSP